MSDEVDDRLSKRFESTDDEDDESQTEQNNMSSTTSQASQKDKKAKNIKKEWNVRSIYLSDNLDSELNTAFKRLDLRFSEADADVDLKKTRHFYPLLVELGLERLEDMDVTEVEEKLER